MNLETKTVRTVSSDYTDFGWKQTDTVQKRHGPHTYTEYVLSRDKDMQNYSEICKLESEYNSLKRCKRTYEPIAPLVGVILFILLIFPLIIYAAYKSNQKKEIEEHNFKIAKQMRDISSKARALR